jgi:hypothetical protein
MQTSWAMSIHILIQLIWDGCQDFPFKKLKPIHCNFDAGGTSLRNTALNYKLQEGFLNSVSEIFYIVLHT